MKRKYKTKKLCKDCGKTKPIEMFGERTGYQKGMHLAFCKDCMNKRQRAWRQKNTQKYLDYQLKYRKEHLQK